MNLSLDINLLRTLVVLAEKESLKRSGLYLGVTESAVSKQLTRLREQLNDELFIRMSGKLVPTSYTLKILPKVKAALSDLEDAVIPENFQPMEYSDSIDITLPDLAMERLGIPLYDKLQQEFPNASVTLHLWGDETESKIVSGRINLGIHLMNKERSPGVYQQKLCDDKLVIATASEHKELSWNEVKSWSFIKQKAIGWNEQKFIFIDSLNKQNINLNYDHNVDNASFALKLMATREVANVLPNLVLGENFVQVKNSEFLSYDIAWAANVRVADRKSPLYQHLHKVILSVIHPDK